MQVRCRAISLGISVLHALAIFPSTHAKGITAMPQAMAPLAETESGKERHEENRRFIESLISQKRSLEDFPERVLPGFVVHEPAVLPFGGTYRGMEGFKRLFAKVRGFYDFSRFEVEGIHAAGDHVFVRLRLGLAGSPGSLRISEHIRFEGDRIAEVRVFVFDEVDAPLKPVR